MNVSAPNRSTQRKFGTSCCKLHALSTRLRDLSGTSVRESWHTKSHELFTIIHITWHENTVNSFWIPKILDRPALQVLALPRTSRWLGQRHDIAHFLPSIWHHSHFCPPTQTCCTRWPIVCKLAIVTLRLATLLPRSMHRGCFAFGEPWWNKKPWSSCTTATRSWTCIHQQRATGLETRASTPLSLRMIPQSSCPFNTETQTKLDSVTNVFV